MTPTALTAFLQAHVYPDSDGKPMADNTKQLRWIVVLYGNLCALFREAVDIFIAADLLWYPVEEHPEVRAAPDVFVAFGRPKGDRGSYQQWLEEDVPPTVVFEILSPGNTYTEMIDKLHFYEDHGVEEYYVYNPDSNRLEVRLRRGEMLLEQRVRTEFVSPRLKIRFDLSAAELTIFYPDGRQFLSFEKLEAARALEAQRAADEAQRANVEAQRAKDEAQRANVEAQRAKDEAQRANVEAQRAKDEAQRANDAAQRANKATERAEAAERRAKRLVELARAARLSQASPEQLAELEQLERDITS